MNRPPPTVLVRWSLAGLLACGGVFVLVRMLHRVGDGAPLIGTSMLSLGGLFLGAVLAAPELARWVASPITNLIDSILLPSETIQPPVDFTLARFYGQGMRYDEACEEYLKILHYHPDNVEACLEGIRAAALAGDEPLAKKFYQTARRILRTEDKRQLLEAVYAARHQLPDDSGEAGPAALPESPDEAAAEVRPEP